VFRAGDGVHTRWLQLSGKPFLNRLLNPFHTVAPWMELRSMRSARLIVPNSHMVAAEITNRDPALQDRIRVIHNGFDGARFHPGDGNRQELRRKLALPGEGRLLLFAGSGWERKGLTLALEILASVSPPASLCVLGKGKPESYANQIHRLGLQGRVLFRGVREDIADYYRAADVFVLPTLYDPFSNACLESLACGTPVITTRTNGAAEVIVEGQTGCLMDVRQPDLRKVRLFLEHLPDNPTATAKTVSLKEQRFELDAYRQVFLEALRLKRPE
jgi:UDP-glucose:(heptosyl)LPS alpha-1,3-glucosyltransferase